MARGRASSIATEDHSRIRHEVSKAVEMTGTPPRSIAPREATFAEQTRHHIAVRLLPFLFVLYLEHAPCREAFDHAQLLNSKQNQSRPDVVEKLNGDE